MKIGKLTIENLNGGWINDFAKGSASSPQTKANTYHSGILNQSKPSYLGQISSAFGENPNKSTFSSTCGYALNATVSSVGKGYFFFKNGIISEIDLTSTWPAIAVNYTEPAGCLSDDYKDIWKHVYTDGAESIFFSYQTASSAYVGYAPVASIASRNNTYKALTYLNVPHVGCVSVGNKSYVTDKHILQAYDPITGTWTSVNCGIGITLTSVCDNGNYVVAVGSNGTTSWAFMWDGTSTTVNFKYDLRDTDVTAVVNEGGEIRAFTYGKNSTLKIKTFTGSGFSEEADWEIPTSVCASPKHGMVDTWLNQIVWKSTDGFVWLYGSPRKNEISTGAHKVGYLTTDTSNVGCVKNLYQNNLYCGVVYNSQTHIYNVRADESYSSSVTSNIKTALYQLPTNSTIERVQFYFSKYAVAGTSSSGSSLSFSLFKDYSTEASLAATLPTREDINEATSIYYHPFVKSVPNVNSFYMDIDFTGITTIKKIVVTYSYEDNDL